MEGLMRTGGSLVGGFFGGPAGAAVGNLVGGGVFDLTDSSQEQTMNVDTKGLYGGNVTDSFNQQGRDVNRQLESMNKQDQMRHITEPVKAYGTAMVMAELGTPAESTGTGADKIVGWDEMSYFDKATRSGKSMVKDAGGWKEVGKNVMSNIGIGTDKVADPEMNNADAEARHALGLETSYDKGDIAYNSDKGLFRNNAYLREGTPDFQDYKDSTAKISFADKSGDDFAMAWLKQDNVPTNPFDRDFLIRDDKGLSTGTALSGLSDYDLLSKQEKSIRDWKRYMSQVISGDQDQRDQLMNLSVEELEKHYNAGTNPIDGSKKGGLIDSILGGFKKDVGVGDTPNEAILENIEIEEEAITGGLDEFAEVVEPEIPYVTQQSIDTLKSMEGKTNKELFEEWGYGRPDKPNVPLELEDGFNIEGQDYVTDYSEREFRNVNMNMPSLKDIDPIVSNTQIPEHKKNMTDHLNFIKQKFGDFGQGMKDKAYKATDPWEQFKEEDETWMPIINQSGRNPEGLSRNEYLQNQYSNAPQGDNIRFGTPNPKFTTWDSKNRDHYINTEKYVQGPGSIISEPTDIFNWDPDEINKLTEEETMWDFNPKTGKYSRKENIKHPLTNAFDQYTDAKLNFQMPSHEEIQVLMEQTGLTKEEIERLIMSGHQQ